MTPQQSAAQAPPAWTGDLEDDCIANWAGMLLHAERIDGDRWWRGVVDNASSEQIVSSSNTQFATPCTSGSAARLAAENAAQMCLGLPPREQA